MLWFTLEIAITKQSSDFNCSQQIYGYNCIRLCTNQFGIFTAKDMHGNTPSQQCVIQMTSLNK